MISLNRYKQFLQRNGRTQGQVRKTQSDLKTNQTFTGDPTYKRVYILTKDGWKWEDAKYQFHTAPSVSKDAVDYYLQFRPKVHYPIGSYVIVPDDTDFDINLSESEKRDPFSQPIEKRTQWWLIVGRDEANANVRYMILKCDWEFKWIYKGRIMSCWACSKSANSYTSGVWRDEISLSPDNLTNSWLPDTHYTYGDNLEELGLFDTRTVMHMQRFFFSNNDLDPKIYQVTKVTDLNPQGIIKLSIKQDEYNEKRDNLELHICDYYSNNGDIQFDEIKNVNSEDFRTSRIYQALLDDTKQISGFTSIEGILNISIGRSFYFLPQFSHENIEAEWRIRLKNNDGLSFEEVKYLEGLMKLNEFEDNLLLVKPGKATSLYGKVFELSVSDMNGEYYSSIMLEVTP